MQQEETATHPNRHPQATRAKENFFSKMKSTLAFGADPLSFTEQLALKNEIAKFHIGTLPMHLISRPDAIEEVLRCKDGAFIKSAFAKDMEQMIGKGLFTAEGDEWRKNRNILAPVFHRKNLIQYGQSMVDATDRLIKKMLNGQRDIHNDMMHITVEIIADTLFKADIEDIIQEMGDSLERATSYFHTFALDWQRTIPSWIPTNARRGFKKECKTLHGMIKKIVASYEANPHKGADLLTLLFEANKENKMSKQQILDEALTIFLAGHETTALTLSYALYLLASNPEAQEKAQLEADSYSDMNLSQCDLSKLYYIQGVIFESMRLYPPIWSTIRTVTREYDLYGQQLQPGDNVMISQWQLGRDSQWFKNPEQFQPERWHDDSSQKLPRYVFLPFGGGMRKCIGDHFAMMEATIILAGILRNVTLTKNTGYEPELIPSVTLRPKNGIKLNIEARRQLNLQTDQT